MSDVSRQFDVAELEELVANRAAMIDVRSEGEWSKSEVPGALNLPILNSNERQRVGTYYKQRGQRAAVELGYKLVSGEVKRQRVAQWCIAVERDRCQLIYCARGGLRSKIAQEWLACEGIALPRLSGGYKNIRSLFLRRIEAFGTNFVPLVVAGRTGSGKTKLLKELAALYAVIDLEGLAKHRGSAFGGVSDPQPAQASFENLVARELIALRSRSKSVVLLESESRCIGSVHLPEELYVAMRNAPRVVLEESLETRIDNIVSDYVLEPLRWWITEPLEMRFRALEEFLTSAVLRLKKRLGGERAAKCRKAILLACTEHKETGKTSAHREWIGNLLRWYYDPLYEFHLKRGVSSTLYKGNCEAIRAALPAIVGDVESRVRERPAA